MSIKKYLLPALFVGIIVLQFPVFADDISDLKASLTDTIAKLVQKYEARIQELQTENDALRKELASLKTTSAVMMANTGASTSPTPVPVGTIMLTATMSKNDIYNAVIKRANDTLGTILSENKLPAYMAIGLFEFVQPNAVFLSLDDGNNPEEITAFKTKILFTFDNNLNFTKIGLFDLDYNSLRYRTVFGTNPYTKSVRTRIENPSYKGKLFTKVASNTGATSTGIKTSVTSPASTASITGDVTLAQIKAAYDKTKLLDALKLSDSYILKNPNDLEVLRIRYRSYYIIGKYEESLAEIKKMETLQWTAFERTIACDAAVIGKIAKKTEISSYYSTICKKK